jgi:hypothetical protein
MVSGINPPSPITNRHDISGNECLQRHEKSTNCYVGHKQLFLITGRRKESTSHITLGAMYHSRNFLEHSHMHVEGSVSGSLTKNFPGVSVVTDHPDANKRRKICVMRTPVPTDMGYKKHFPPRETAFAVHQA